MGYYCLTDYMQATVTGGGTGVCVCVNEGPNLENFSPVSIIRNQQYPKLNEKNK